MWERMKAWRASLILRPQHGNESGGASVAPFTWCGMRAGWGGEGRAFFPDHGRGVKPGEWQGEYAGEPGEYCASILHVCSISDSSVVSFLPPAGKKHWTERRKKRWIVLVDDASTAETLSGSNNVPILILKDAIHKVLMWPDS